MTTEQELQTLAADVSEILGEQLIARGERMLAIGRDLLMQAARLNAASNGVALVTIASDEPQERSVGKMGAVTIVDAVRIAKKLGTFTRADFVDASGLKASAANRWLSRMMESSPPALVRVGAQYEYVEPPQSAPAEKHKPVEKQFIGMADPRPQQVPNAGQQFPKTSDKAVNEILRKAFNAGWTITRDRTNHLSCYPPVGSPMFGERLGVSATPPKYAHHAIRADFKKWGLDC